MMDTRRPPLWWELPLGLLTFLACTSVSRASLGDKRTAALANAHQVLRAEQVFRLDVEEAANRWLTGQGWVLVISGYHYAAVYVLTSIVLLVYLYLRDPPTYRWARRSTLLLNGLAALCFWLYPVAPPRLNPQLTIVDTVASQRIWGTWGSPVGDAVNQLAALPSLHFAWVLWVLVMLIIATRPQPGGPHRGVMSSVRRKGASQRGTSEERTGPNSRYSVLIALAATDVVLTAVLVVATGNHYPLDLVAGAVLVAICIPVTRPWPPAARQRFVERLGPLGAALRRRAVLTDGG